jgi:hypothetical protein
MVKDGDLIPRPGGLESHRELMRELDLNEHFLAFEKIGTDTPKTWSLARVFSQKGSIYHEFLLESFALS